MSVDAGIANQNARTVKKELTDLLKPLNDTLQRLQALRCSVDCVFNFLQGKDSLCGFVFFLQMFMT